MSDFLGGIGNQLSNIGDSIGNISGSGLFSMFFHIGQSKLGMLTLDVLTSENLSLPSEVTKYPVEDGDEDITDHITAGNEEITINGAIASGSILGIEFGLLCYSKMIDAIGQLRTMHKQRTTFTVVTGLGKYEDMAFTNLTIDRNNSPQIGGQWITINATLRKIRKVSLKQADLPPDQTASGGDANGKTGATEKKSTPKSPELSYDPNSSPAANLLDNAAKKYPGAAKGFGPLKGF